MLPTSVEGFRLAYGRTPTVAELRSCIDIASDLAETRRMITSTSNGCDCYDPECTICCDENGDVRS